jgi:hypothetical protein
MWRGAMGRLTILIATFIGGVSAQSLDVDGMSKDDLNKLSAEQSKNLPVFKLLNRVDPQTAVGMRAWVPMMLRNLGYGFREAFIGSDEQLQRWVTQFQHDIGEPETGVITFGQVDTLSKRSDALKKSDAEVTLPLGDEDGPEITLTKDYAIASGTFIIEGDKIYHDLNITTFECYREWGYCYQSDVDIDDKSGSSYYVNAMSMLLKIVSWNDEEVVANNEALCATTTTTINVKAKEVYQITRNNGNQSCTPLMRPLAKPQISKLVSGFNVSQDYFAKKRKEADGYRSKEYQEYLGAMRNSFESAEKAKTPTQAKASDTVAPKQ